MQIKINHKKNISAFLIIGTLLALYLTIEVGYAIYWEQLNTLMLRGGVMSKIALIGICMDFPLLFIAGFTSTISFFRKGHIWKPITKGIIINIIIWLLVVGLTIGLLVWGLIYKIIGLLIIGSCIWLVVQIWKMIRL